MKRKRSIDGFSVFLVLAILGLALLQVVGRDWDGAIVLMLTVSSAYCIGRWC